MKSIYVGNLSFKATADDLRELFGEFGQVHKASIILDRETDRSRGFGFVEMEDAAATKAIDQLNGEEFQGRTLTVNEARPQTKRPASAGDSRGQR